MNATQDTKLETLLRSPIAQAAIAEAEAQRHAERRDALARLAVAEAARREAIAEAVEPIPALREAHQLARQRLRDAALALHRAECAQTNAEAAGDAGCAAIRSELVALGDAELEATRRGLLIEQAIARNADDFRAVREPDAWGGEVSRTIHVDRGGAHRLQQISGALAELDAMGRDPAFSPAAIARRCDELREAIETGAPLNKPGQVTFRDCEERKPLATRIQRIKERVWR